MNRHLGWLFMTAAALSLTSCTGGDPPHTTTDSTGRPPAPATTTTTTVAEPTRPTEAPPVADPVDLRPFHSRACDTLTTIQQSQLGFPPLVGNKANKVFGSCEWEQRDSAGNLRAAYWVRLYIVKDPLAAAYRDSNDFIQPGEPTWEIFEPRQVRGLPAVARSITPGGDCDLIVGTGNGQGMELGASDGGLDDPTMCDRLTTAAEWAIDTVRG